MHCFLFLLPLVALHVYRSFINPFAMRVKFLLLIFSLSTGLDLFAQTTQTEFGKNRVQFHRQFEDWFQYESPNFITYWYGEARLVAQSAIMLAEYDFQEIQGIVDYRMNDKIEIIVYTDLTDLKQSNIGSEEAFVNTGGQTKIVGTKMFIYFDGNHNNLRRQIRSGIASVYLNAMLFGSNLQEIVQNAVMMNLPEWFRDGLVDFVGEFWSVQLDDELRQALLADDFEGFEKLAEKNPRLAGHSLWYFIASHYGFSTVSNLIYLTRIHRSVESGFLFVLGTTYERTLQAWEDFYRSRYTTEMASMSTREAAGLQEVKIKNRRKVPITTVKLSPDGKRLAYVLNEIGRVRVYVQDLSTGDRKLVFRGGFRNAIQATDYNYPLLAWSPNNQELAVLFEKRDQPKLLRYNVLTEETEVDDLIDQFQRVYSMDYTGVNELVFSAAVRGQSDLFLYFIRTRQSQRLTTDFWDDLDVAFARIHGRRGVLFASNRPDSMNIIAVLDSVMPVGDFDIYFLDLDSIGRPELVTITNTPHANERQPIAIDSTWFAFLTDESGVVNRKTGYLEDYVHHFENLIFFDDGSLMRLHADSLITEKLDSVALSHIDSIRMEPIIRQRARVHFNSNYARSIALHHQASRSERYVDLTYDHEGPRLYTGRVNPEEKIEPFVTQFRQQLLSPQLAPSRTAPQRPMQVQQPAPPPPDTLPETARDTGKIDIDNYLFQSEFDDEEVPSKPRKKQPETVIVPEPVFVPAPPVARTPQVHRFRPGRITPYRLTFRTDYVTTQMDNSLLFDGLNSYAGVPQDFGYPPPGILLKANFKDLLEDYEFEGGIRVPTSFNGAEYFLLFKDRKRRLDKHYALYRRRLRFTEDPTPPTLKYDNITLLGQYQLRYPLDVFTSLRGTATLRMDKTEFLATDRNTLETPPQRTQRAGIKAEFVFDNTLDVSVNIKNGTRYKVFLELVKSFQVDFGDGGSFSFNKGFMTVAGVDFRHYQRVFKYSILAGRLASATSFGKEKILYMLGGTDNWLIPRFDNTIPLPAGGDFAYRSVATNARGFLMNARNGNSYALVNAEFRSPVLRYIFKRSQSNFVRNFQVVAFFDAGTAWEGLNPFNEESPLNTWIDSNNNVTIQVNYFRDPIIMGYGVGMRTLLFGYFVRLDYARGIETRQLQDPRIYFSIGMDF